MGSSGSKAAKSAGAAARKYPTRASGLPPTSKAQSAARRPEPIPGQSQPQGPTVHSQAQASGSRSEAINLDARDPDFAEALRKVGPVKPMPTYSPSSTSSRSAQQPTAGPEGQVLPDPATNPSVKILVSRQEIEKLAEEERAAAGSPNFAGRTLVDVNVIKRVLTMRDEQGMKAEDIEKTLQLKKGMVASLGKAGVIEVA